MKQQENSNTHMKLCPKHIQHVDLRARLLDKVKNSYSEFQQNGIYVDKVSFFTTAKKKLFGSLLAVLPW